MATTIDEITTTINDLADAYAILDTTIDRDEHLGYLLEAAEELKIPADLDAALTDDQAEAIDAWIADA